MSKPNDRYVWREGDLVVLDEPAPAEPEDVETELPPEE